MFFQTPWIPEIIFWLFDYETVKQVFTGKRGGLAVAKMSEEDVEAYKYALSRPGMYYIVYTTSYMAVKPHCRFFSA